MGNFFLHANSCGSLYASHSLLYSLTKSCGFIESPPYHSHVRHTCRRSGRVFRLRGHIVRWIFVWHQCCFLSCFLADHFRHVLWVGFWFQRFAPFVFTLSALRFLYRCAFIAVADGIRNIEQEFPAAFAGFGCHSSHFCILSKFAEAAPVSVTADFIPARQERLAGFCFFPASCSYLITDCAVFCVFLAAAVAVLRTVFAVLARAIHVAISSNVICSCEKSSIFSFARK